MTNGEKFKTAKERTKAFNDYCERQGTDCNGCPLSGNKEAVCRFAWLDLQAETEEEKPMDCPCCGYKCVCINNIVFCANKQCEYTFGVEGKSKAEAIAAHNRVCNAVAAFKESEVANG